MQAIQIHIPWPRHSGVKRESSTLWEGTVNDETRRSLLVQICTINNVTTKDESTSTELVANRDLIAFKQCGTPVYEKGALDWLGEGIHMQTRSCG